MQYYIVKTEAGRRYIVAARSADNAAKQVSVSKKHVCPWSGKTMDEWKAEKVNQVAPLGTVI